MPSRDDPPETRLADTAILFRRLLRGMLTHLPALFLDSDAVSGPLAWAGKCCRDDSGVVIVAHPRPTGSTQEVDCGTITSPPPTPATLSGSGPECSRVLQR